MKTYMERTDELFDKMMNDKGNRLLYRNQIVEINLRLVAHILKKYRPYTDDQYQAGCMGLIVAVDTFDAEREVPFSSYACFCIEREIHKMHRASSTDFDVVFAGKLVYLDSIILLGNGDEATNSDLIADLKAEGEFDAIVEEHALTKFFEEVVKPSLDDIVESSRSQATKVNLDDWRELELRYILALADEDSQKGRFNYTQMAKALGLSVQNVRNKHLRVIEAIKKECIRRGYFDGQL